MNALVQAAARMSTYDDVAIILGQIAMSRPQQEEDLGAVEDTAGEKSFHSYTVYITCKRWSFHLLRCIKLLS